jgi:hypothetical protein
MRWPLISTLSGFQAFRVRDPGLAAREEAVLATIIKGLMSDMA